MQGFLGDYGLDLDGKVLSLWDEAHEAAIRCEIPVT